MSAEWAGGLDGGAWLDCAALANARGRYRCVAYHDFDGSVWAEGEYVVRLSRWNQAENKVERAPVAEAPDALRFAGFDGQEIHLADSLVLVPDGPVRYPFEGGGKTQSYTQGEPQGEAVQYSP